MFPPITFFISYLICNMIPQDFGAQNPAGQLYPLILTELLSYYNIQLIHNYKLYNKYS